MEDFKDNSLRIFLAAGLITVILLLLHGMRNDGQSGLGLLEPAAGGSIGNPSPIKDDERSQLSSEMLISFYY